MDRLTLEVLAKHNPARAVQFTPESLIGMSIECAACALKDIEHPYANKGYAGKILERTHLVCPSQLHWKVCHCGRHLRFTD